MQEATEMAPWRSPSLLGLFNYTTVKYVATRNKKVGFLYRVFQLTVMGYLIGWVFVTKKGYQAIDDTIESSVVTKVKGVAQVNTSDTDLWGPEDYLIPFYGGKVLFIITNFIETPKQTLRACPESPSIPFGIKTGICIQREQNETGTCEIYGWCPTEKTQRPESTNVVQHAENFTVYIRNFVRFSQFNFSTSNIEKDSDPTYLKSCLHDAVHHPYCPIFRLGDIVSKAGYSFQKMAKQGGSIGILIEWSCDLDTDASNCHPNYSFMFLGSNQPVTAGYNFRISINALPRFARYSGNGPGKTKRTHFKVFGIHLEIMVFGT
ncbi:hypothetical protein DNTS_021569, partial [Danionella cerebrum]